MPTLTSRLTADGILLTNTYFDEITKTWVSIAPEAIYAKLFDEVFLAAGSITFAGSGDYLSGTSTIFNIGASGTAWTFETWVYPQASGGIFSIGNGTQYGQSLALDWGYTSANKFTVKQGDGSSYPVVITTGLTYSANAWYHVAVSCTSSGVRTIYINGVSDGTYTTASAMSSSDNWVVNGFYDNNGIGNTGFTGYMSNLRFVVGTAVYVANFTPPYAPLVSITNTQLLLCMPNNGGLLTDSSPNNFRVQVTGNPGASGSKPFTVNTVQRQLNTGTLQVSGYFDEETGIS
jgi:Concanavalin A-like lectin/glucanases superfamily